MSEANFESLRLSLASALDLLDHLEERANLASTDIREAEIALRRARSAFFPSSYFADVAWDILLELDKAHRQGLTYSVTDVGADANIPTSTLMRYAAKLEADGYIERRQDREDGRRVLLKLTDFGKKSMDQVFDAATRRSFMSTKINNGLVIGDSANTASVMDSEINTTDKSMMYQ
jgi:MarR family transcriptional regulator, temperature-dependent positive regulator of motility